MKQEQARHQTATTKEKNRGRIETHTVTTNIIYSKYLDWAGAKLLIKLQRHTIEKERFARQRPTNHKLVAGPGNCGIPAERSARQVAYPESFLHLDTQFAKITAELEQATPPLH